MFSYAIEFTQLYIPDRDSGWEDVFTNGSGSFLGGLLYVVLGVSLVRWANAIQRAVVEWLTPFRFVCAIAAYFCFWFGLAAVLQRQTQLSNWKPYGVMVLGNSGPGANPRQGQIQTLQIWNHPLNAKAMAAATASDPASGLNGPPIVEYDSSRPMGIDWIAAKPAAGRFSTSSECRNIPAAVANRRSKY